MQRRKRQTIIAAISGVIGLLMILGVGWIYFKQYRLLNYENSRYGFSLKYPVTWSFGENQGGAVAIFYSPKENALDLFRENVNIVVQDLSRQEDMTLKKYTETAIKQMQVVFGTNLQILDSSPTMVSNGAGHQFAFIGKGDQGEINYLCRWTIVGTTAYQITYTGKSLGYPKHLAQAQRIMKSFRID